MSSSILVTKKRRTDETEYDLRKQRSTKNRNASVGLGSICKTRTEIEPSQEAEGEVMDCEFFKQISDHKEPDADQWMWLSSGSSSPPSCYGDPFSTSMSLSQRLVFALFFLANMDPNMKKARILLDETYSDLQRSSPNQLKGEMKDDDGCKIGISETFLDLDEESSNWNSDTDVNVDFLQADFPSPSRKNKSVTDVQASNSSGTPDIAGGEKSEALKLEDCDPDEPIFWPSDVKFAWGAKAAENLFVMSPPKKKFKPEESDKTLKIADEINSNANFSEIEAVNLDDFNNDEPLVWPTGQKFDWGSEAAGNLFAVSPSKKKCKNFATTQEKLPSIKVGKVCRMDDFESEAVNLEDFEMGEPLVWPSDQKFELSSEAAFNFFIMSPLKKKYEDAKLINTLPSVQNDQDFIMRFSGDDPLFWPSDQAFDWDSDDARNYFIISPRKNIVEVVTSRKTKHEHNDLEIRVGRKRNRGISPDITSSKIFELRCLSESKGACRTRSVPAKLNEYSRFFCEDSVF